MTVNPAEHEAVLQFMYQMPLGVAQLSATGDLGMSNPSAVQMTLQIAPGCLNLFEMLERHAPEVQLLVEDFSPDRGAVLEDYRVDFGRRDPSAAQPLVVAFTIIKLGPDNMMVVMQDVSRSAAAEHAARQAESRLRLLSEKVRDYAVFDLDHDGQISEWSVSAQRLFSFEAREVVGKGLGILIRDADGATLRSTLERARRLGWASLDGWWSRRCDASFRGSAVLCVAEEGGTIGGFTLVLQDQSESLRRPQDEGKEHLDPATGALLKSAFDREQQLLFDRWSEHRRPMAIAMIDVDRLLKLRDDLGEELAQDALRIVIGHIRNQTLPQHILVRWSFDRFALLMPETDLVSARRTVERTRTVVEQQIVDVEATLTKLTLSAGVTILDNSDAALSAGLERAQHALDKAKTRGRNQVVVEHPRPPRQRDVVS